MYRFVFFYLCILSVLLNGSLFLAPAFSYELDYPPLTITQEENGWRAEGGYILFDYFSNFIGPTPGQDILFVIEYFENPNEGSMVFIRDFHRLSAYRLTNGQRVFSSFLFYDDNPFIPRHVYTWKDQAVVNGFYQEEPSNIDEHKDTRRYLTYVFDSQGEIISTISSSDQMYDGEPIGIISSSDQLIWMKYNGESENNLVRIHKIPSGELENEYEIGSWTIPGRITIDQNGNLFLIRRPTSSTEGVLERYSLSPWQHLWTKTIDPIVGYLEYLNFEIDRLWYGFLYRYEYHPYVESIYKWDGGPIDPETGEPIESDWRYNPLIIRHKTDGILYQIEKINDNSFRVKKLHPTSAINFWNVYGVD